ncbi:hypothetical protein ACIQTZ_08405 [Paenarthrobacter sp. NPDC090520]|uniref:hypothetical protein n=1 Tax=Paenarthrobacter sp. NPDC090520 TaxID=3364382 RepID=UPI0038118166
MHSADNKDRIVKGLARPGTRGPATNGNYKRTGSVVLVALVAVLIAWAGSILWVLTGESDVPPDEGFRAVPGPSQVREITLGCGSGGCWREMVIDVKPPQTAPSLAADMGISTEQCGPLNLWTLRKTCTGVAADHNGELRIYLKYDLLIDI